MKIFNLWNTKKQVVHKNKKSPFRVVDTRRFVRKIGSLEKKKFELIRKNIKEFL